MQTFEHAIIEARADLMKPSPCGQKFADGTPHPMACVERRGPVDVDPMERTMPVVDVCLVCASEQKLRADLEAISSTAAGADSMVTELRDNLAALREGLAGLVEKWKRLGPDAWLGCIEQGQKKCAAELSNFLIQKGER